MTLDELKPGQRATILTCQGRGAAYQRLAEMGLVPGAKVRLVRVAPLGDPIEIEIGRFHLAIRRSDARLLVIKRPAEAVS